MKNHTGLRGARQQYAAAQAAQFETKDLHEALELYKRIVAAHPDAKEAGYSRSQIQNIVKNVVPEDELLEAQVSMAMAHLGGDRRQAREIPVAPALEART
jgi:hypothetical protein